MPLDDNEQKILAEIEKQFYSEDPALARAVNKIEPPSRLGPRMSALGVIAGLAIIVAYVDNLFVAIAGFILVVLSATSLVTAIRLRDWTPESSERSEEPSE